MEKGKEEEESYIGVEVLLEWVDGPKEERIVWCNIELLNFLDVGKCRDLVEVVGLVFLFVEYDEVILFFLEKKVFV
jgi:hypothetical protein